MPQKSRKGRAKYKGRRNPKLSPLREVSQQAQALSLESKKVPVAKSPITIGGQADRYRPVTVSQELRRILSIAGVLLVLLIVLSLLLR